MIKADSVEDSQAVVIVDESITVSEERFSSVRLWTGRLSVVKPIPKVDRRNRASCKGVLFIQRFSNSKC